jgi:RNA polymerase sigma factor (sigma-70 family)
MNGPIAARDRDSLLPRHSALTRPALAVPECPDGATPPDVLVRLAAAGDKRAWEQLVDQYSRLIWAMTKDFRLRETDAADVVQATWLRLLEHIGRIEYPERIGSWLATTARHECLRQLAASKRVTLLDDSDAELDATMACQPAVDERLLAEERAEAVRAAVATLPTRSQQLLELLMADPPVSYTEISDQLGVPIGSIGPTRGRCLERLRLILQLALRSAMSRADHVRDDPPAPGRLDAGESCPDFGQQVRHEQHDRVRLARQQRRRAEHRNVGTRHPQPVLSWRGIGDTGQHGSRDPCLAQQGHGAGRGTVAEYCPARGSLFAEPVAQAARVLQHLALQPCEHSWISHAGPGLSVQQLADSCVRAPGPVGGTPDRQQDGAPVKLEQPRSPRAQAVLGQHGRKSGRGVIGIVAVPQRIPLVIGDDRLQRMELQQQRAPGREPSCSLRHRRVLVRSVHQAEAVNDHVGLFIVRDRLEAAIGGQPEPGPAVRAAILGDSGALGQHPRSLDSSDRVSRLRDQRDRLCSAGLGRDGRVSHQLRKPAAGAQPHLQRIDRVRTRIALVGEPVAGRLIAEVKNEDTGLSTAGPARHDVHFSVFPLCHRLWSD